MFQIKNNGVFLDYRNKRVWLCRLQYKIHNNFFFNHLCIKRTAGYSGNPAGSLWKMHLSSARGGALRSAAVA